MKLISLVIIYSGIIFTSLNTKIVEAQNPKLNFNFESKQVSSFLTRKTQIPRKLQDTNYITITFDDGFATDTCWYSHIENKISSVKVDDQVIPYFKDSFSIFAGSSVIIYFNTKLVDLSYFLSYNADSGDVVSESCKTDTTFKSHIVSIDLSNLDTSLVTNAKKMFFGYSKLTSIDFLNIDASKIKLMDYMFSGCISLTSIDLSYFNTPNLESLECMFYGCKKLSYINLGN